eukprot:7070755-Karenia_brevis.AAC.1
MAPTPKKNPSHNLHDVPSHIVQKLPVYENQQVTQVPAGWHSLANIVISDNTEFVLQHVLCYPTYVDI